MEVQIDAERFFQRIQKLKTHWQSNKSTLYGDADALCIQMGTLENQDGAAIYSKSTATHLYFLGYEFPDSLFILTNTSFFFMATSKKCSYLETALTSAKAPNGLNFQVFHKNKDASLNSTSFGTIVSAIKGPGGSKLGTLIKGSFPGPFMASWSSFVDAAKLTKVDISNALGLFYAIKEEAELESCKRAAVLTNKVMKHAFVAQMEETIDKDSSIKHDDFSFKVEAIILDPNKIGVKVSTESVESCYTPVIQSGGKYDIKPSASSNNEKLSFDIIICSLGARYKNYCANISRTYMIDPPPKVENSYNTLVSLFDKCLEKMIPGNEIKDVLEGAKDYLNKKDPSLLPFLPKTLGFAIGLEFRDSTLVLNSTNTTRFTDGMVFTLIVGFHDIPLATEEKIKSPPTIQKLEKFSLLLADTIYIRKEGAADILTKSSRNFGDDNTEADNEPSSKKNSSGTVNVEEIEVKRSERLAKDKATTELAAAQRQQRQEELMAKKLSEARRRLQDGNNGDDDKDTGDAAVELRTYRSTEEYPKDLVPNQLKVDLDREAVIVPIFGQPVPFHVSTIKNVVLPDPDRATYLRINFYTPGQALSKDTPKNIQALVAKHGTDYSFIKELTFRSLDPRNLTNVHRMYLELRKRVRQREQQAEEERGLVIQEKLIRLKDERIPRLQDLTMRPQVTGRKTIGSLESHQNGLRFLSSKGEVIDIMYANVRHALFQPCEKSVMVLIHFNLKEFVMIGKKKHKDVQFYTEVVDASQNLDGARRAEYDPDELDEEQREREMRKKLNLAFKEFCKKVERVAKHYEHNIEFDIPYPDLGFYGSCYREMVFIQPTVRCLVNLTETPFFVVDLSDIEHVHFERVSFGTKNFDMIIIFKDLDTPPKSIIAIEMQYYDAIQDWLNDVEITYTYGVQSINWTTLINQVVKNDPRFYFDTDEGGEKKPAGWTFLSAAASDDEEDDEDEGDSSFAEESGDSDEEEDSDDDDDDDDSSFDDEDDDDEEEDSWEELERDAQISDRAKRSNEEVEDDAPKKKLKKR
eukprot:gene10767-22491_t